VVNILVLYGRALTLAWGEAVQGIGLSEWIV